MARVTVPTTKIYEIRSDVWMACEICSEGVGSGGMELGEALPERVNHMLEHGLKLLHVGTETTTGPDGEPWQVTVAVLEDDWASQVRRESGESD